MAEKEYIERQTARNAVLGFERYTGIDELPVEFAEAEIDKLPAADVAPVRHGRWIRHGWSIVCSECGEDYAFAKRNYCPNCGARMDRGSDDGT